jgi:hypothetical protein
MEIGLNSHLLRMWLELGVCEHGNKHLVKRGRKEESEEEEQKKGK